MTHALSMPEETKLTEFFGVEPNVSNREDGYWCYEVIDNQGITLRFSVDLYQRSIQTALLISGKQFFLVSHEAAEQIRIEDKRLECNLITKGAKTKLTIDLAGGPFIKWATLITE